MRSFAWPARLRVGDSGIRGFGDSGKGKFGEVFGSCFSRVRGANSTREHGDACASCSFSDFDDWSDLDDASHQRDRDSQWRQRKSRYSQLAGWTWSYGDYPGYWYVSVKSIVYCKSGSAYYFQGDTALPASPTQAGWSS